MYILLYLSQLWSWFEWLIGPICWITFLTVSTSMPCEMKPRFLLLYGSQKGQAQAIAEGVAEEAETHGLVAELSCLENNEKVTFDCFGMCVFISFVLNLYIFPVQLGDRDCTSGFHCIYYWRWGTSRQCSEICEAHQEENSLQWPL